jgi:hypothetical protein
LWYRDQMNVQAIFQRIGCTPVYIDNQNGIEHTGRKYVCAYPRSLACEISSAILLQWCCLTFIRGDKVFAFAPVMTNSQIHW